MKKVVARHGPGRARAMNRGGTRRERAYAMGYGSQKSAQWIHYNLDKDEADGITRRGRGPHAPGAKVWEVTFMTNVPSPFLHEL